jgi:hypothetical protein
MYFYTNYSTNILNLNIGDLISLGNDSIYDESALFVKQNNFLKKVSGFFIHSKNISKKEIQTFLIFYGYSNEYILDVNFLKRLAFFFSYLKIEVLIVYFMEFIDSKELYFLFGSSVNSLFIFYKLAIILVRRYELELLRFYFIFFSKIDKNETFSFEIFKNLIGRVLVFLIDTSVYSAVHYKVSIIDMFKFYIKNKKVN